MKIAIPGMLLIASCVADDVETTARIAVAEPNELGVTALEVERGTEFEVRGLDAHGSVQALVHRRVTEADGTELTFSIRGDETRLVTRETQLIRLLSDDVPAAKSFLALDAVRDALALDRIEITVAHGEGEVALSSHGCWASALNQSPTVSQCCEMDYAGMYRTIFVLPSGQFSIRYYNNIGYAGCRAQDGVSPCDGASCYYGPNGYARAVLYNNPGGKFPYTQPVSGGAWCQATWASLPPPPAYPAAYGGFPNGQGCPGGDDGAYWDY